MKVFLVKDMDTGLYSSGGSYPRWVEASAAKRYKQQNHASSHIRQCCGYGDKINGPYSKYYLEDAKFRAAHPNLAIIECEIKVEEGTVTPYIYD